MKLVILLAALAGLFGGAGFCLAGSFGAVVSVALLVGLVGHFAVGFQVES